MESLAEESTFSKQEHHTKSDGAPDSTLYDNIPDELKALPQWVGLKLIAQPTGKKSKKVPINPASGRTAAVDEPASWGTFQAAVAAVTRYKLAGIGFVFTADDPYTGIDLDGCRDPTTGALDPWALDIVHQLDSYTEASVSGTGVHIIPRGNLPSGGGKHGAMEMYDHGRYFVMTGEQIGGFSSEIEERQGAIDALYAEHFPHKLNGKAKQDKPKKTSTAQHNALWRDLFEALPFIPAVEYDPWLKVGMGLHSVDSSKDGAGYALWVEWSQRCPEKFDLAACLKRWQSFSPDGGITEKSIFALAIDHGWRSAAAEAVAAMDDLETDDEENARLLAQERDPGEDEQFLKGAEEFSEAELLDTETPQEAEESENTQSIEPRAPDSAVQQPRPRTFNLTDLGNGERLVASYGNNLRYCNPWKQWLAWDGMRWRIDHVQQVKQWARATVRALYREVAALVKRIEKEPDKKKKKAMRKQSDALLKHAVNTENGTRVAEMVKLAQMDVPVMPEALDNDPWLLNVKNGTLDLRTGDLRPHQRADLLTKYIPIAYDPDARCPQWEQFLADIMAGEDDLVKFLWKALGYSLTGDVREDCLFLLYGTGHNGKTTFIETISFVLGDYGTTTAFATFLHQDRESVRNDLAALQGARFVSAVEADQGKRLSEALIKRVTGKDTITARFLFQEYFQFKPQLKLWLAANYKPVIKGTDDGIWRRIRLVPFTEKFDGAKDDKSLGDKLQKEAAGILTWMVRGCLAWQADGLPLPETIAKATGEYRTEMDELGNFIKERCVTGKDFSVKAGVLYNAYVLWSGDKVITQTALGRLLTDRGFKADKRGGGTMWRNGIALSTAEEE